MTGSPRSAPRQRSLSPVVLGGTATASFNSKLRDELLNGEIFYSLAEARIVIESWGRHYNPAS